MRPRIDNFIPWVAAAVGVHLALAWALRASPTLTLPVVEVQAAEQILIEMRSELDAAGTRFAVALIPSKQRVYEELLRESRARLSPAFWRLIDQERVLTAELQGFLDERGFLSVDTTRALRSNFARGVAPYPEWDDEHPNAAGYGAIADEVRRLLAESERAG